MKDKKIKRRFFKMIEQGRRGYPISKALMERFKGKMIFVPVKTEKKKKKVNEK